MADLWLYALATLAFFIAVGIFSRWLEYRSMAHEPFDDAPFVALRSPSRTNAFDRRIEAALRDAARGFRLCRQCLFTNRALAESCVVCGCRIEERESPNDEKPTQLTRRQRRARTRKRWVRRLGEDGETIVWSCVATEAAETEPFYVLHLTKAAEADTASTGSPTNKTPQAVATTESVAPDTVAIEIEEPENAPPVATLTEVGNSLCEQVAHGVFAVTAVSDGTTAPLPVGFEHDAVASPVDSDWKDAVTNAEADFPSKLAQFVTATSTIFLSAALQEDDTTRSTRLSVHRDALLATSIEAVATMDRDHARAVIRVDFVGEQGIDAGGVYREWLMLLNEQLLEPAVGVFVCVDPQDQVFYLNPHSRELLGESHLAYFLAAGRLVGRALLEGNVTGFHLALPLLKIMLGEPVGLPDLEFYDPELIRNLQWLLQSDNVDALGLDFTVVEKRPDGTSYVVELIPDGALVEVTDVNKHAFVDCRLRYVLFERVRPQLFAFLQGLYDLVPPALLALLDSEELDYLIAGSDDIDVDDWQRNSQTTGNLLLHPALPHFWTVVRELSLAERRLLLQFATGSTRVPPGGFAALTSFDGRQCAFTLHGTAVWRLRGYLRSHACFNRVDLPLHFDLPTMRRAVAAAISVDTVGFTSS